MEPGDLLGDYGGDEFVVLLRNSSATVARERVQALLHAVEDCTCIYQEQPLRTTASIDLVPFQTVTRIAHVLEKHTIAEHIETLLQRDARRELGVDYAQGYAIDRPQPLAQYSAIA